MDQPYEQISITRVQFSIWRTFKRHIPRFLLTILVDVIFPLATFLVLQKYIKPVYALLAASSPPLIMVIIKAVWFWTFDALGFLVFLTFAITAVVAVVSRNPTILLLEKSLMTGLLSIIFGVTLIPCKCFSWRCQWRPLAYYFYQDLVPTTFEDLGLTSTMFNNQSYDPMTARYVQLDNEQPTLKIPIKQEIARVYAWLYKNSNAFRYSCYCITTIWSIGFLSEFLARLALILLCHSINKVVIYGHIILSSITALMIVLTVASITIERKYTLAFVEKWKSTYSSSTIDIERNISQSDISITTVDKDSNMNYSLSIDV